VRHQLQGKVQSLIGCCRETGIPILFGDKEEHCRRVKREAILRLVGGFCRIPFRKGYGFCEEKWICLKSCLNCIEIGKPNLQMVLFEVERYEDISLN
jgi:hypothetical protein